MPDLHCPTCGTPVRAVADDEGTAHFEVIRGHSHDAGVPLDAYEAVNLLEAFKLVPDTGDWHGQLQWRALNVIKYFGTEHTRPNATAEQMAPRALELAKALTDERNAE